MYRLAYCLSLAFLLPQAAAALGLGELKKHSELNQPFHATIELVDANAEELDTLRVKLADAERFRRAGIERPHVLSQLRFEVVETGSGPDHIKITSHAPIQEPYLSFLIEVSWSNGRLFREYAALLDPPVYDRATQRTPQGRAPDVARPAAPGPSRRPSSSVARAAMASPGSYGPTVRGDTLWEIALLARSDSSLTVQQVMMALLRANPDAFFQDNINALKAGAVLNIPDVSIIAAVSRSEAVALTGRHWALWEQYRGRVAGTTERAPIGQVASTGEGGDRAIPPGSGAAADAELKLLAANTAGTAGVRSDAGGDPGKLRKELDVAQETLTSQKQEIGELNSKLTEADEIIKLLRRQIDVKDAELATLQARAAASVAGTPEAAPGATPQTGVPETGTPAASGTGAAVLDVPGPAAESPPETASPQGADPAPPEATSQGLGDEAPAGAPLGTGTPDTGTDGAGPGPGQVPDTDPTAGGVTDSAGSDQAPPAGALPDSPTAGLPEASPAIPAEIPSAQDGGILEVIPGGATTLGIAIALILGSVAVAMRRKRAAEVAPIEDDFTDSEPLPEPWDRTSREGLPQGVTLAKGRAAVGETTGPVTALEVADTVPPVAREAAIEIEEEDALSDINVYLAYERFDEAEETVKQAIAGAPDEHKLKLKLLEVYYAAGNNAAFEQYARVLQSAVDGTGPLWHSALAMWQAMSPERALFTPATGGEPILATAPPREFIDISSTIADTQGSPPVVGREKTLPAASAGGRTLEVLDFDLTGVGTSSTPDRERVVDVSTGNELEWDGSGLVVDTARATQGGGALIDLGAGGEPEEKGPEVLDLTVSEAPGHSSVTDSTATERAGVMPSVGRSETAQATAERFGTAPGAAATIDFGFGDEPEKQDKGLSGALEGTSEVMFNFGLTAGEAPTPARVDHLLGDATIDLAAPVWPEAPPETGRPSARSTLADDHRFSTTPKREERDRAKEDSVEFDLGDIDLEVVETSPPDPIETATVVDTVGFEGPRASMPPASAPPASTIDRSLGSRLAFDPGVLEPGDDGIGVDEDTSSELDVKLNLAKAYIELGDAEGARAILQEVTREGTSAERDEAAQLLAQIA
ncbi:MAG: FimV/HubP family polar landmark protein [Gammaproteobacteria bacterium]